MNKSITLYKILEIFLIVLAIIGYFTVADDLRHTGEFIGVTSLLLSGIIFLLVDLQLRIFKRLSLQWIAVFILLGIPFGGTLLDNMPVGIGMGFFLGLLAAIIFGKRKTDIIR